MVLGEGAETSANNSSNQIVIGYNATGTGNNEIALGNTNITAIKAQVASINSYSDKRIKKDIRDGDLGLDFIKSLRTVKYKMKNPADYPIEIREKRYIGKNSLRPNDNNKIYNGLIAQEVKQTLDSLNLEWSGWSENKSDGKQGLQYGALTIPLIKAVQEQQAQIEELQAQIKLLMSLQTANTGTLNNEIVYEE